MNPNDRLPLAIPPRDRFMRAIAEQLSPERIAEVHLFQPIRQGGVETCVAVIAADRVVVEPVAESDAADFLADETGPAAEQEDDALDIAMEVDGAPFAPDDPYADEEDGDTDEEEEPNTGYVRDTSGQQRHTVFTAWYRLTLKGPERGKWEFNLENEAVAPLDTIVAVARGVGERAGDADDPERWTGDHFRAALLEAGPA